MLLFNNMERINIDEIFENAMKDPSLFSTLDIENLLDSIENTKNDYLENKTTESIAKEILYVIRELKTSKEKQKELCEKLIGYRYVDEIHELHKGKYIRWIRIPTKQGDIPTLTNGGIVVNLKFMDNGVQVVCKNAVNRFIQYKYDDCLTFQKLSTEEQLLLMAYDHLENEE